MRSSVSWDDAPVYTNTMWVFDDHKIITYLLINKCLQVVPGESNAFCSSFVNRKTLKWASVGAKNKNEIIIIIIISTISNSMVNWKTVLTSGGVEPCQVVIRRGIFEEDSLSPSLFIVVMLALTLVLRKMKAEYKMAKDTRPINH